jgi:SAM-dependent methyltransferase
MSLRHHEIAEASHRILNPFTEDKLMLVGEIGRLSAGQQVLDLACGKGELLCRYAERFGIGGLGVDLSEVFLAAAAERATELGVTDRVRFRQGDAAEPVEGSFDVVSCLGATWIGGGLVGTLDLMRRSLRPGGLLLVGEPYWISPPPAEAVEALGFPEDSCASLAGTLDRFEGAGVELVEMVLATPDSWDRYVAAQWWTVHEWLRDNADDPEAPAMREYLTNARRSHLSYQRTYLGWGVFVLRG